LFGNLQITTIKMKNWLIIGTIILATGFLAASYLLFAGVSPTSANKNSAPAMPLVKTVNALGRLEPADKIIKLTAPPATQGTARLVKLFVKEGDEVQENQIVAEIDGKDEARAVVLEAEKQVGIAQSKLAQVRAGAKSGDIEAQQAAIKRLEAELNKARIELRRAESPSSEGIAPASEYAVINRLQADLERANSELRRSESLASSGDVSKSELETRQTTVKTLTRQIEEARSNLQTIIIERRTAVATLERDLERNRAQLASVSEVRPTDVRAAAAEVENAQAALVRAKVALAELDVSALTAGRVLKINTRPGESLSSDGILELGETAQMFVVAEVFEEDISKVKNGQRAEMVVRSTGEIFRGTVAEVGWKIGKQNLLDTDPVADVDARVVEVRIKLDEADSRRTAGLTNLRVDVRINVDANA
jgi:HlyD family secretion protein